MNGNFLRVPAEAGVDDFLRQTPNTGTKNIVVTHGHRISACCTSTPRRAAAWSTATAG